MKHSPQRLKPRSKESTYRSAESAALPKYNLHNKYNLKNNFHLSFSESV